MIMCPFWHNGAYRQAKQYVQKQFPNLYLNRYFFIWKCQSGDFCEASTNNTCCKMVLLEFLQKVDQVEGTMPRDFEFSILYLLFSILSEF